MPKKILISGINGLVGSNVNLYLKEHTDWEITSTTTDLRQVLPDMGDFDVILHLASRSSVEESIADPVPFVNNNVTITLNMLEYARKHPPEMFINFSTTGIYSTQTDPKSTLNAASARTTLGLVIGESLNSRWGALLPTSPYIASKVAQEAIAYSYFHTYKVPVVIVSSGNIVGPGQLSSNFVPKIIEAAKSGKEISIYTNNGEIGSRIYNSVTNVADALMFLIENVAPNMYGDRPDTFSISGGERLDNLEMAQMISNILGKPLKYKLVEGNSVRPGCDAHYNYTDDGLERIGWSPSGNIRSCLEEMLKGIK